MTTTHPLLAAVLAMRHTHEVVSTYADGRTKRLTTRSAASAETYARTLRPRIGRELIDRDTGKPVRYVSVDVRELAA